MSADREAVVRRLDYANQRAARAAMSGDHDVITAAQDDVCAARAAYEALIAVQPVGA